MRHPLDDLARRARLLAPADAAAAVLGRFDVTADEARDLRHGKRLAGAATRLDGTRAAAIAPDGALVGHRRAPRRRRQERHEHARGGSRDDPVVHLSSRSSSPSPPGSSASSPGLAGRRPSDWTVGSLALVELLLLVQIVVAIVAPFVGNPPTGSLLEFWVYLVSAALAAARRGLLGARSSAAAGAPSSWASRRSSVAVMVWRMQTIWTIQVA